MIGILTPDYRSRLREAFCQKPYSFSEEEIEAINHELVEYVCADHFDQQDRDAAGKNAKNQLDSTKKALSRFLREWEKALDNHSPRLGHSLDDGMPVTPFEVEFSSGCAPMIRSEAFQQLGGYDERYFLFYEDADLSLRLQAQGWRLLQVPAARVCHHGSASVGKASPRSRYYQLRNRLLFSKEHAPQPAPAARARFRLRLKSRLRAYRYLLSGRRARGQAILCALRDAKVGKWGPGL